MFVYAKFLIQFGRFQRVKMYKNVIVVIPLKRKLATMWHSGTFVQYHFSWPQKNLQPFSSM